MDFICLPSSDGGNYVSFRIEPRDDGSAEAIVSMINDVHCEWCKFYTGIRDCDVIDVSMEIFDKSATLSRVSNIVSYMIGIGKLSRRVGRGRELSCELATMGMKVRMMWKED